MLRRQSSRTGMIVFTVSISFLTDCVLDILSFSRNGVVNHPLAED